MFHKTIRSTVALVAFGFSLSAATAQMVYNRGSGGDPETLDSAKDLDSRGKRHPARPL